MLGYVWGSNAREENRYGGQGEEDMYGEAMLEKKAGMGRQEEEDVYGQAN